MGLKPRHYLLIAVILLLGLWNFLRRSRAHRSGAVSPTAAFHGPSTPAWQAFDHAVALRDAPEPQFTPAIQNLRTQAGTATGTDAPDLRNCLMWLEYYRHSGPIASGSANNFGMLATSHVQTCMAEHRDVGR